MDAKNWLEEFREIHIQLCMSLDRLEAMEAAALSPRSAALDGMPHGRGATVDTLGNTVSRLEAFRKKVEDLSKAEQAAYEERDEKIGQIKGKYSAEMQTVLRCRYLDLMDWDAVANVLRGGKDDFWDKYDNHLRLCYYRHKMALEELQKILDRGGK